MISKTLSLASAVTAFCARVFCGFARHPISIGRMLTPCLTPHLTVGQIVFTVGAAIYVVAARVFEERDLVVDRGDTCPRYTREVPAFLPRIPFSSTSSPAGGHHETPNR